MTISSIKKLLSKDLKKLDVNLKNRSKTQVSMINDLSSHIITSGGKRLRPILLFLSAYSSSDKETKDLIDAAVVVEFIHAATLLHDDVIDKSKKRRGNLSVNEVWGNKTSVLVGDFLFSRAFQLMTKYGNLEILKILSDTSVIISEGEVLELTNDKDPTINEDVYFDVINGKTASLFSAACQVGGISAKGNIKEIESLKKYNSLLREQIKAQATQINGTELRINKIAVTERKIPPLFLDMIEDLEGSIDQSLPFQKTERRQRIEKLKVLMKRPNLSLSEKYQQILEAYRVESNYGKTMTTYRDHIVLDGKELQVDILQLGRLGLFFSTFSREQIGMWDASSQSWIELNQSSFKKNIRSAINIAKGNEPEDLLVLPFPSSSLKNKTQE